MLFRFALLCLLAMALSVASAPIPSMSELRLASSEGFDASSPLDVVKRDNEVRAPTTPHNTLEVGLAAPDGFGDLFGGDNPTNVKRGNKQFLGFSSFFDQFFR